jgi:transcriptional regulator with XRE-family HTH domain
MDEREKRRKLNAFGESIRNFRLQANFSQEELAEQAGIDRSYLGAIERGEHNPALLNIIKIAKALGVHPHQLLEVYVPEKEKK